MKKYSFLGAVVLAASALASPAMAQQVIYNPGYCAQFYPNANCQNLGPGNPYTGSYQRRAAYQQNYNRWDTGNPYTRGYQQRVAYQPTGWNTSYNRWDTGNPYTRGYQQSAAYQPTGWNNSYNHDLLTLWSGMRCLSARACNRSEITSLPFQLRVIMPEFFP